MRVKPAPRVACCLNRYFILFFSSSVTLSMLQVSHLIGGFVFNISLWCLTTLKVVGSVSLVGIFMVLSSKTLSVR